MADLKLPPHGASKHGTNPLFLRDEELRQAGSRAIQAIGRDLLYARVDLAYLASGQPAVMELELIEPSLYFPFHAGSPGPPSSGRQNDGRDGGGRCQAPGFGLGSQDQSIVMQIESLPARRTCQIDLFGW